MTLDVTPVCPLPHDLPDTVQLAHGGGGRAMKRLIDTVFRAAFDNPYLAEEHDGALVETGPRSALTTDSYVVWPLIFPGGDIGRLAVNGTVNDLAMCGARPRYMTAGFILEEGLSMATLTRIVASMADAAATAGIPIVTGDVKVVDKGKADGLYINTAGVGDLIAPGSITPRHVQASDAVIISGDIGRHGIAVMAARHELGLESEITSDCAPLAEPVLALIDAGIRVHCLRDLTRGGLASALVEVAETSGLAVATDEAAIPVRDDIRAACELLGLDPVYVANEGRFVAFLDARDAENALAVLTRFDICRDAAVIGSVKAGPAGRVTMRGPLGADRVIDMLSGEQLPRIC
jgi:hydrogenase expression/formation protein HypE